MTKQEALEMIGDRAKWELVNMRKALTMLPFFNSDEDDKRLEAVKVLLRG